MNYDDFRWCLHKHDEEEWDISRYKDQVLVYLRSCGGIRTEEL